MLRIVEQFLWVCKLMYSAVIVMYIVLTYCKGFGTMISCKCYEHQPTHLNSCQKIRTFYCVQKSFYSL